MLVVVDQIRTGDREQTLAIVEAEEVAHLKLLIEPDSTAPMVVHALSTMLRYWRPV